MPYAPSIPATDSSKKADVIASAQVKPTENRPAQVKPAEVKPTENRPAQVKPAEVKPTENRPAEVKWDEIRPISADVNREFQDVENTWSSAQVSEIWDEMQSMSEDWARYDSEDDDMDDEGDERSEVLNNLQKRKKILEVSGERPKTAPPFSGAGKCEISNTQRWKHIVSQLGVPLSTMMARACVNNITNAIVTITLPIVYREMVKQEHIRDVERILSRDVALGCRLSLQYDENVDESETLAAQEARAALEFQQSEFDKVKQSPIIQTITRLFHVELDEIRFTFNPDRIIK